MASNTPLTYPENSPWQKRLWYRPDMLLEAQFLNRPRMSGTTVSITLLTLLTAAGLVVGCDTGAVAVSECREIEGARCIAAIGCGTVEADEVDDCRRFYRNHCLHGIVGPEAPSADSLNDCVGTIEKAGQCALDNPEQSLESCLLAVESKNSGGAGGASSEPEDDTEPNVCDLIGKPWDFPVCDFLNEGAGGSEG